MLKTENQPFAHAMAFFHQDGLPAAWKQAMKFAGKDGRLATMPDIIATRLESKPGDPAWEMYYTTLTAEYLGLSKAGRKILIVAHGIGPMSTMDGAIKAYRYEFKDPERRHNGGRISQEEFWELESGKFGEVNIIDFDKYCKRYQYPFISHLRLSEAIDDEVVKARFGPQALHYLQAHAEHARAWHLAQAGVEPENRYGLPRNEQFLNRRQEQHLRDGHRHSNPYLVQAGPSGYPYMKLEEHLAVGYLLSISQLQHMHHDGNESLTHDVSTHDWSDGTRLVGIQADGSVKSGIHSGPDAQNLLRKHWRELLVPMKTPAEIGFRALLQIGKQWFTQYPKSGARMDTWEPEYIVPSAKKIGKPVLFRTTGYGSPFFKFDVNEVQAIAPPQANAYFFIGDPTPQGDNHVCMVQFYLIEVDTSKRMTRVDQLARDYEKMMKFVRKDSE